MLCGVITVRIGLPVWCGAFHLHFNLYLWGSGYFDSWPFLSLHDGYIG
jgi:hypothetical protein